MAPTDEPLERTLFKAADKLRKNIDAAQYKHVVLGLIFLKYISDAFETLYESLQQDAYADPEDRDEYQAENVFFVPKAARWSDIQNQARQSEIVFEVHGQQRKGDIGIYLDHVMDVIEAEEGNEALRGILPRGYGQINLDMNVLRELIDLVASINLRATAEHSKDLLGRIYEYFLGQFALLEGKQGGQFYTPKSIVALMVEMLQPTKGRVYDPCCGSGGMFVMSEKFVENHQGKLNDIVVYGQESNHTTYRLCRMNLAVRGINAEGVKWNSEGSFLKDALPDLRADYVLANPPFNISDWWNASLQGDARWQHGTPPKGNANYAWLQHILFHLAPRGSAGVILANGSMSSNTSGEGEIRKALVEADQVECMLALPGQLFFNTQIPACVWFLSKDKGADGLSGGTKRNRQGEVLFIDARNLGYMKERVLRDFSEADIHKVADTFHAWQQGQGYEDVPGFCYAAKLEEIAKHDFVLTPGRYVGAPEEEADDEPFAEKMERLTTQLKDQFAESAKLEAAIKANLAGLGYEL